MDYPSKMGYYYTDFINTSPFLKMTGIFGNPTHTYVIFARIMTRLWLFLNATNDN